MPDNGRNHIIETVACFLMAVIALGGVYLLFYSSPVGYVLLVAEDQWGEYGTFVTFGVAGGGLLLLALKSGPTSRKLLWALAGICLLFIAAEEISWGQRIFKKLFHIYIVPDVFRQMNAQGELNFHNLGALDSLNRDGLHSGTGFLLLGWVVVSAAVSFLASNLKDKMEKSGFPLIPSRLFPLFLLVPYCFLIGPLPNWSEIGELFMGIAVLAWAVDLFSRHGMDKVFQGGRAVALMLGVYILCAILTVTLTWLFPGDLAMRLNYLAVRSYPKYEMYHQAEQLYEHIYRHPKYLKPETRINHARMLINMGRDERANEVLRKALSYVGSSPMPGETPGGWARRRGIIHSLRDESDLADKDFTAALELDRKQAELAESPEEKAKLLWSMAQTLEAQGDLVMALQKGRLAREAAITAKLSGKLDRWILSLRDQMGPDLAKGLP